MGVDVQARLHQQIQQVLVGLRDARQPNQESLRWRAEQISSETLT